MKGGEKAWLNFVRNILSGEDGREGQAFFKVRPDMRQANRKEYDHIFFTFGPYHANLRVPPSPCDRFKLQTALALTTVQSFETLVANIRERDSDIRELYVSDVSHNQQALAYLLALDALTIVAAACNTEIHDVPVASIVMRDAFLLEHQLPLFVLQFAIDSLKQGFHVVTLETVVKLYAFASYPFKSDTHLWSWSEPPITTHQSMIACIYGTLTKTCEEACEPNQSMIGFPDQSASSAFYDRLKECSPPKEFSKLPTASELQWCGIKFVAQHPGGFTTISFDKRTHVLSLPEITMFDYTPSYLLNLCAYEVASRGTRPVTSYIMMMNSLINTEQDVKLLVKAGVIKTELEDHTENIIASIWNKMCYEVPVFITKNDEIVIKDVNVVRNTKWNMWISKFHKYICSLPWLLSFCLF